MKKSLLALTVLSTMIISGVARAAWIPGDTAIAGLQLDFSGTITSGNSDWAWRIPDNTMAAATNLTLRTDDSTVASEIRSWELADLNNKHLLEGYMVKPTDQVQPGLVPEVSVGSFTTTGQTGHSGIFSVSNAANHVISGTLTESAATIARHKDGNSLFSSNALSQVALLLLQQNYADFNKTYGNRYGGNQPDYENFSILRNPAQSVVAVSGALVLKLTDVSLKMPKDVAMGAWSASLPITISMK